MKSVGILAFIHRTRRAGAPGGRLRDEDFVLRFWRSPDKNPHPQPEMSRAGCAASCALASCPAGFRAMVVEVRCAANEARRLRSLGVFEGARVGVVDTRSGILLDVRGSRLALDHAIASAITVRAAA